MCVDTYTVSKHIPAQILVELAGPPPPQLGMWSNLRKWRTQTHFKHTHTFFQQRSSDDKTFPRCLRTKFSDLLSALMDVAVETLGAVCRECFQGFYAPCVWTAASC